VNPLAFRNRWDNKLIIFATGNPFETEIITKCAVMPWIAFAREICDAGEFLLEELVKKFNISTYYTYENRFGDSKGSGKIQTHSKLYS
jgi:hypothetical protein